MIRAAMFACLAGAASAQPLPFDVGGAFELIDQTGVVRTQADPEGKPQLLFFGYANCQQICSAALPLMGQAVSAAEAKGIEVTPVMITVDPARDTIEKIAAPLIQHHPDFKGLTGEAAELQVAYDAFQVEHEEIFTDPEFGPVFAHGSFIYLLDGAGEVLTLFPPILAPGQVGEIITKYVAELG